MKKGEIIQLQTIDKRGFISFNMLKIKDARVAKRLLKVNGYREISPSQYFCSHQYDKVS